MGRDGAAPEEGPAATVGASCLCGDVAWRAAGAGFAMSHCHCSMCRKSHGTAYGTYLGFPAAGFAWVRGRESVVQYESSPGFFRPFCGRCGSVVAGEPHDGAVFMPAGNLDDDPGTRPAAHLFVAAKAPWWAITDDLPTFDAYPPGMPSPDAAPAGAAEPPVPGEIRGGCLCGDVRYAVLERPDGIVCCHCSRCRKGRSAAHGTNLFVAREAFRWVRGEDRVAVYRVPEAERFAQAFCRRCGAQMPYTGGDRVMVPAGGLDDDPGARPVLHIHVGSRAPWHTIHDDVPKAIEGRGSPAP